AAPNKDSLIVLQGANKAGKSTWMHFLSRYLTTDQSFESQAGSIPSLHELLSLVQCMTSQPGITHDFESRLDLQLTFQFPASGKKAVAVGCSLSVGQMGALSPAQFYARRPSFAIFRLLDEEFQVEGRHNWYDKRRHRSS
ncbi:unnamed protein product, partial [Amoebophrya sp. A120]